MNEQEKALQGMIEFCQWLIPNAKQFGLEQSESIAMISRAQTPDDIVNGMNSLYQELGEEQFAALTQAFQQSKVGKVKTAKNGAKIDYLVKRFEPGGVTDEPRVRTHVKNGITPLWLSFVAARKTYLPQRRGTTNPRYIERVWDPSTNTLFDRIYKDTGEYTERKIMYSPNSPDADTLFKYKGNIYLNGEEMYDRYQNAWNEYGVSDAEIPNKRK